MFETFRFVFEHMRAYTYISFRASFPKALIFYCTQLNEFAAPLTRFAVLRAYAREEVDAVNLLLSQPNLNMPRLKRIEPEK